MTPHYTCPSCGYHLHHSPEITQAVCETLAAHYKVSVHSILWDKYSTLHQVGRARSAVVFALRRFTAATFREIGAALQYPSGSTRPGHIFARTLEEAEQNPRYAVQLEEAMEVVSEKLKELFQKKLSDDTISE